MARPDGGERPQAGSRGMHRGRGVGNVRWASGLSSSYLDRPTAKLTTTAAHPSLTYAMFCLGDSLLYQLALIRTDAPNRAYR